jgi:hypothetical protein
MKEQKKIVTTLCRALRIMIYELLDVQHLSLLYVIDIKKMII